MEFVDGFSKKTKNEKRYWLEENLKKRGQSLKINFDSFNIDDPKLQERLDEFSENTISNFPLPYGLAPNFLINGETFTIPMVSEESSVVAAASHSAKFWKKRGGFKAEVLSNEKLGHVHFLYKGEPEKLKETLQKDKKKWLLHLESFEENMRKRGGGIKDITLEDFTDKLEHYYTLELTAHTCDAMGANFLNTLLEELSEQLKQSLPVEVIMSILSNYTEKTVVKASVNCSLSELDHIYKGMTGIEFAERFCLAVNMAKVNPKRAVTHNKGILNGIDGVILATGNDYRAIEACIHAYAARNGSYESLSKAYTYKGQFIFELEIPLALGVVGGITSLHPLSQSSLEILGRPSAEKLMEIVASVGLAQNFGAVKSLVTSGIQKGHMKMHLLNILKMHEASPAEVELCKKYFADAVISVKSVRDYILKLRSLH